MRITHFMVAAAALVAGIGQASAQDAAANQQAWCGQYLIGQGPRAPRAATPTITELARWLPGRCRAGDILFVTYLDGIGGEVAPFLCDYTKTITIEPHPANRGGGTSVTCSWIGYMRGMRPITNLE